MAVNYTDFDKIWASASPLTPYEFNENNYKAGWNFVGATPPSRQMWDAFMKNADEKLQYLYHHEDIPLGHEYFTFNPNVPQGSLPLFGGEYSRETYSDLWAWVQTQTGYLKTEAEWQTLSASNNGNVPYYSDGDGSTTFRVPSLKCWVRGANGNVSEVGSYLAAGLPNITGDFARFYTFTNAIFTSGAFAQDNYQTNNGFTAGSGYSAVSYNFDASRSSSVYGNSTTVQPESIVGMWLVKAYGVIVDTGSINEQAYIDDRYNAMKTYVDWKFDTVVDISNQVSVSSTTSVNVRSIRVYRFGKVIQLNLELNSTTAVNVGGTMEIYFSGLPSPIYTMTMSSFVATTSLVGSLNDNGHMRIRVLSANLSANESFGMPVTYLTNS